MEKPYDKKQFINDVGNRLREVRIAGGFTQEFAAEVTDTSQQNISNVESGRQLLPADALFRLCLEYGVSCDYILSGRIIDADTACYDPRTKKLSPDQFMHYKAMNDHFFSILGIQANEGGATD